MQLENKKEVGSSSTEASESSAEETCITKPNISKYFFNKEFSEVISKKRQFRRVSSDFKSMLQADKPPCIIPTKITEQINENWFVNKNIEISDNNNSFIDTDGVKFDDKIVLNSGNKASDLCLCKTFDDLIEKLNCLQSELNETILKETLINTDEISDEMLHKRSFSDVPSCFNKETLYQNKNEFNGSFEKSKNADKKSCLDSLCIKDTNLGIFYGSFDDSETNSNFSTKNGSLSVGDLTSYEFYDQSDVFRDSDVADGEISDASDEANQQTNKPKRLSKRSFIGESISVDIYNEDEGYVSNKSRRNGLNLDSNSDEDEFLTDLIEFKKKYEKSKHSAMRIAKSVENILRLDKTNWSRNRSMSDPKSPKGLNDPKSTKFFKKRIFLKQDKQHMADSTEYFHDMNNQKNRRLSVSLIEDTAKKLSGINEIYLDEHGHVIKKVKIKKLQGQSLGFFIRSGNGMDSNHKGIFVSRVTLGSFADVNNLLYAGDEILRVNQNEVNNLSLEEIVAMMQESNDLHIETKSALPLPMHSKPKFHKTDSSSLKSSYTLSDDNLPNKTSKNDLTRSFSVQPGKLTSEPNSYELLLKKYKEFEGYASSKTRGKNEIKTPKFTPERNILKSKHNNIGSLSNLGANWFYKTVDIDTSSLSDSNEGIRIYESDKIDSVQRKNYTGSLNISIHKITGCREQGCFSCSLEIDGESKANTSSKIMEESLEIEESFEIEVNQAVLIELKLFLNKKEKPSDVGRIYLGKIFAYENQAQIILKTDKYGIKLKLNLEFIEIESFLKRAPSRRIKGVFGFNIAQTLIDDGNTIPLIVRKCVEEIEMNGLSLEGIYRISGNARKKKILRAKFEEKSFSNDDVEEFDCHVFSGVLKDYLRELPQPLISQKLFLKIYEKSLQNDRKSYHDAVLLDAMRSVHYSNRATLIYIIEHLLRVASKKDENKMDFKNLAVCFGPVMMCPPSQTSAMLDFKKQVDALEYLLEIWPKSVPQNQV
ncbi:uncharacterized protein LOC100205317 [Hydra vulgaris]|uniref:Uncharacterized protein LOC100205317 n=1 Tax=Hydra vulgaris TaxID=6087 RepID=A0ABM4DIX7_HYDVU